MKDNHVCKQQYFSVYDKNQNKDVVSHLFTVKFVVYYNSIILIKVVVYRKFHHLGNFFRMSCGTCGK